MSGHLVGEIPFYHEPALGGSTGFKQGLPAPKVLISAGEASGDLYGSYLAAELLRRHPDIELFGCAGTRMQRAGVRPVVDSASLAVAGVVEVLVHLPRIYGEYRKLVGEIRRNRPDVAVLTDSPDFHLRLARELKRMGIPVIYFVAPQVWAWRKDRLPLMRRTIDRLLCIFPFEQDFFRQHGIGADYIGHPLTRMIQPSAPKAVLRKGYELPVDVPLVALLPGSRSGEVRRHLPYLLQAAEELSHAMPVRFVLALPDGFSGRTDLSTFSERFSRISIQVREGQTWDVLACADLALAASGTVTIEACLLKVPMIAFYRVNALSWQIGKLLVRVPFYSMVNLMAGKQVIPELIQDDLTGSKLAQLALALLRDHTRRAQMISDLESVANALRGPHDPIEQAASVVEGYLKKDTVHA
ncbi:MAG: lipid-A-disaccharide synthase [Acidobacteriota bacterium]|nr:lipid-A-disaccharide synthase [Acidobacteriota bacterium]